MALEFRHSRTVIEQLARDAARTPPADGDSSLQYVDRSLTILGRTFDIHNQRMRQEFLDQRDFITNQFRATEDKTKQRFGEVEQQMKQRFGEVEQRFEQMEQQMKQRFGEVEQQFEKADKKLRNRLDHMQKASRNSLRIRGWEEIYPVGPFDDQGEVRTPKYFPHTVRRFWRLKGQSHRHRLIYLLRFYNIRGHEEWDTDAGSADGGEIVDFDDSSDSSSKSSRLPVPLETAVQSNPEIAHRALAAQLGLMYDEIQKFMDRAQELNNARAEQSYKRRQIDESSADKRRRMLKQAIEEDSTELTTLTEPLELSQE